MPTLSYYEIADAALLAKRLADLDLPGQRSKTAIRRLRQQRRARRALPPTPSPLTTRFEDALVARYSAEVARRGGETAIRTGDRASDLRTLPLKLTDRADRLVLLHVDGWRYYSRRFGSRRASLSYLCGRDDAGDWTVRVPGTLTTVSEALAWVTPAVVSKALTADRRVDRQGDVYAIATTKAHDALTGWIGDDQRRGRDGTLSTSHHWDAATRMLTHHPIDERVHSALYLPHPVRFVQQRAYIHGRGRGWGAGD